jgi:hypothetical protein
MAAKTVSMPTTPSNENAAKFAIRHKDRKQPLLFKATPIGNAPEGSLIMIFEILDPSKDEQRVVRVVSVCPRS